MGAGHDEALLSALDTFGTTMDYINSRTTNHLSWLTFQYVMVAACFVLFIGNFALHDSRGLAGIADTFHYLIPAANLAEGHGYSYLGEPELTFPPGYGLSILPLYAIGFKLVQAAVITNVFFLLLTCLFTYLICRFYVSKTFALVAILFIVTNAYIMDHMAVAHAETAFMAAISGSGYFVLKFIHGHKRNPLDLIVAGALNGWATLTRPEGMGIALALVGFLVLSLAIRQPSPRFSRKFVAQLALFTLAFAVPLAAVYTPYTAFLSRNVGQFTLTTKVEINIAVGNAAMQEGDENAYLMKDLYLQSLQSEELQPGLRDDILRFTKNFISYVKYSINENIALLTSLLFVLAICAWRGKFREFPLKFDKGSHVWEPLGFCVFMLSPIIPMSYFIAHPRLFVPYNLFVIIGGTVLMGQIFAAHSNTAQRMERFVLAFAIAVPFILLGAHTNIVMSRVKVEEFPLQMAAVALSSLASRQPVNVMTLRREAMVSYYANDRRALFIAKFAGIGPQISPDALIETMRANGLQYLLLDQSYILTRPRISLLWTCPSDLCPPSVRLLREDPGVYRIFELSPNGE